MHPSQYRAIHCRLVGVNGSGKSTSFKAIMGFVRLTSGKIHIQLAFPRAAGSAEKPGLPIRPQSKKRLTGHFLYWWKMVMMGRYGHMGMFSQV